MLQHPSSLLMLQQPPSEWMVMHLRVPQKKRLLAGNRNRNTGDQRKKKTKISEDHNEQIQGG
jgi:hypothetical protein